MSERLPESAPSTDSRTSVVSLVLLLLGSSFFAFYHSNAAYTSDEVWSVKAASLVFGPLLATLKADVHPPLYFQILHEWIRLLGTGEQTVRALSALFYLLSILTLYKLGRELYGSKLALIGAALYACSPLAILSAQFARMYSLLAFLSILSTWLYLRFSMKDRNSLGPTTLYVVVNILGTFTHIAFFFTLFAQIVSYFWWTRRLDVKRFGLPVVLSVTPYMFFWAPALLRQIGGSSESLAWVKKPGLSMVIDLLIVYGGVLWLVLPIVIYMSWRRGCRFWEELTTHSMPPVLLGLTILPPILISLAKPVFNSRLAIVGLHLFVLAVVPLFRRVGTNLVPLILMVLTAAFLPFVHPSSEMCDNRAVAVYLTQKAHDNDVVIFTSLTRMPIDYYLQQATTKQLFEVSFPAEIDNHPGYVGRSTDPSLKAALQREAYELVDKVGEKQSTTSALQVFFLHGLHPEIDLLIERELEKKFERVSEQEVKCAGGSPYFTTISVYKRHH